MSNKLLTLVGFLFQKWDNLKEKCKSQYLLSRIPHGNNCHISGGCAVSHPQNLELGSHVWIGDGCRFLCAKAKIHMGNHVMIAANTSVVTGDHRIDQVGCYLDRVTQKREENDRPVVIEDDVWIGMNVTILKGVTIGTGSVIGAGSVITRDVPPYSICYCDRKQIIRSRFAQEQLAEHKRLLAQTETTGG